MKKYLLLISFVFASTFLSFAQMREEPCAFDQLYNNESIKKAEQKIKAKVKLLKENRLKSSFSVDSVIKIIPVVVHVFHKGGAENISQAQVESQIRILNEDFGKLSGTNGDGAGVDTKVRFCLAKIDPNGNCTSGIVRINSPLADHQTYQRAWLKQLSFWDNTKYLNIYVLKSIAGGTLGYSSFPGGPPEEDGMVVRHNYFGDIGTASAGLGRTTSHEIGHWFGLYHVFQGGCGTDICNDGDFVCDTPPQATASFNCSTQNTCSNDSPDVNDQKENYMSYTNDACKSMFTDGQRLRMHATLDTIRTVIWSESNLIATGCDSSYTAPSICGVKANVAALTSEVCIGNSIYFMDISLNDATSWKWTFTGGTPASDTTQNPTITYNTIGTYDVSLIVSNANSTDTITLTNYVTVSSPGIGDALNFTEDFELGDFPTGQIYINNPDGGITWELDSNAATSGKYSVRINNFINTNYGTVDELILPYFDLTSGDTNQRMTFNWAYAKSDNLFSDDMIVQISTDCGNTFTSIFAKSGNNLVTGPTQTTFFIPDSTQWRLANIKLNAYRDERYVLIKIVNVTDGGNNLYIDDINVIADDFISGIDDKLTKNSLLLYPNPAEDILNVHFDAEGINGTVDIINYLGKIVESVKIKGNKILKIPIKNIPNGIYFLKMTDSNKNQIVKKFIIK